MLWNPSTVTMLFLLGFLLMGLTVTVLSDPYIRKEHRKIILITIALMISLLIQDVVGYFLDLIGTMPYARTVVGIYGYSIRPLIILMYFYIFSDSRKVGPFWALIGINTLIHLTALFSGVCFSIDASNVFHRGPLGYSCHVISGILLLQLFLLTLRECRNVRKAEIWIPLANVILIIASVILDSFVDYREYPFSFLIIAIVCSNLFYYIWLHLRFVREHEDDLKAQQRIRIMMTQIQPHFLYNTLTTIQSLCRTDPEEAFNVTEKFGTYLRQNLDTLNQTSLIPIQKELEHTRVYAEIEAVRFPRIQIEYDIEDTGFSVPALTVQPLVENAIRHGVRIRQNGLVTIATRKGDACHEIVISDNGKGFDWKLLEQTDETHIGIRNVRERIETMCNGTLTVNSQLDKGTIITIRIPAGRRDATEKGA